jgi:hypothetical protein
MYIACRLEAVRRCICDVRGFQSKLRANRETETFDLPSGLNQAVMPAG